MKLLALDTACAACSVAAWDDGVVVAYRFELRSRGHAEVLMPMVETVVDEAGFGYRTLDLLAVTRGPGTFTGVRIGLSAARGLALATGRPLRGLTTLEVIAADTIDKHTGSAVLVAIEARRGEVYAQRFAADGRAVCEPKALTPNAALALAQPRNVILAGNAAQRLADIAGDARPVASGHGQPDARVLAGCAAVMPLPGTDAPVAPLYLRGDGATPPDGRGR